MTMSLHPSAATLIAVSLLISACAGNGRQATQSHLQEAALQRWADCVDRQSDGETVADALSRVDQYCEGHKRDLLAAYPEHLESQISAALVKNTHERAVREIAKHTANGAPENISVTLK